jgi:isopentenyl phosphate kinase
MNNLTLIKLGGSIITNKKIAYSARKNVIRRLAKELKNNQSGLILAHGSGSFGHTSAVKFGGKKGYKSKIGIATVALDAIEINRIVMKILVEEGLPVVAFSPMSMFLASAGEATDNFFAPMIAAIDQGLIPVVYGDVIWDKKWNSTIFSGETTLNIIAKCVINKGYKISKIIEVGETDGVYDNSKKTIPLITKNTWPDIKKFIFKLKTKDVTGGMLHKVEQSLAMTDLKIETWLINGKRNNELSLAILGKKVEGTLIK